MARTHTASSIELNLQVNNALRLERLSFGAKVRAARAVLGQSQTEFAHQVGLTQKSVHRIEQGAVEPKLRTRRVIEQCWRDSGIGFEDLMDGGFRITVQGPVLFRA
jgi:DNA-binding XRE family transcriptional regulator